MKGCSAFPKESSTAGTSPSDCFVSYTGHLLEGSYPSAEKQSVYSTVPVDWEIHRVLFQIIQFNISTQFRCQNSFISSNSVQHKYVV